MAGEVAALDQHLAAQGRQVVDIVVPVTRTRCGLVRERCWGVQDSVVAMNGFQYFVIVVTVSFEPPFAVRRAAFARSPRIRCGEFE
jgi:hypothetical protein